MFLENTWACAKKEKDRKQVTLVYIGGLSSHSCVEVDSWSMKSYFLSRTLSIILPPIPLYSQKLFSVVAPVWREFENPRPEPESQFRIPLALRLMNSFVAAEINWFSKWLQNHRMKPFWEISTEVTLEEWAMAVYRGFHLGLRSVLNINHSMT